MTHKLKTHRNFFEDLMYHEKTFEVRKDDRYFNVGDILVLEEWNPETKRYTGRELVRRINYILPGGQFGIESGYVVMAIK